MMKLSEIEWGEKSGIAPIDHELKRLWEAGEEHIEIVCSSAAICGLIHIAEADGSIIRVQATEKSPDTVALGVHVTAYIHPVSHKMVKIVHDLGNPERMLIFRRAAIPEPIQQPEPHPFEFQKPTPQMVEQITTLREACKAVYEVLLTLKSSRERSVAITKLREVSMWGNASVVFNEDRGEAA